MIESTQILGNNVTGCIKYPISSRPISKIKFNPEGDLLFAAGKSGDIQCYSLKNYKEPISNSTIEELNLTLFQTYASDLSIKESIIDFDVSSDSERLVWIDNHNFCTTGIFSNIYNRTAFEDYIPSSVRFLNSSSNNFITHNINNNNNNNKITENGNLKEEEKTKKCYDIICGSNYKPNSKKSDFSRISILDSSLLYSEHSHCDKIISNDNKKETKNLNIFENEKTFIELKNFNLKETIPIHHYQSKNLSALSKDSEIVLSSSKEGFLSLSSLEKKTETFRKKFSSHSIKEIKQIPSSNLFTLCSKNKNVKLLQYKENSLNVIKKYSTNIPILSAEVDLDKKILVAVGGQSASDVALKGKAFNFQTLIFDLRKEGVLMKLDAGFLCPSNSVSLSKLNKFCFFDDREGEEEKDIKKKFDRRGNLIIGVGLETGEITLLELKEEYFEKKKWLDLALEMVKRKVRL